MASTIQKIPLSEVFIYVQSEMDDVYDICLLTRDGRYIEYTVQMKTPYMSFYMGRRISEMFVPFQIDAFTNVVLSQHVRKHSPLFIYFEVLQRQIRFNMSHATLDKIFARFWKKFTGVMKTKQDKAAYRQAVKNGLKPPAVKFRYSARNLVLVWNEIIRRGGCGWINPDVDRMLGLLSKSMQLRHRLIRVCVYYMVVKRHLRRSEVRRRLSLQDGA